MVSGHGYSSAECFGLRVLLVEYGVTLSLHLGADHTRGLRPWVGGVVQVGSYVIP